MDKETEIKIYKAVTKKPRKEFVGILRMFEPIKNLAITTSILGIVLITTLVAIFIRTEEALRIRLENWEISFETWQEAYDYVENPANYLKETERSKVYLVSNDTNYYELNGTTHSTSRSLISNLISRAKNKSEYDLVYADVDYSGIGVVTETATVDVFTSHNSYMTYKGGNDSVHHTKLDAITSILDVAHSYSYNGTEYADLQNVLNAYLTNTSTSFQLVDVKDFHEYRYTDGNLSNLVNNFGWDADPEVFVNDIFNAVHNYEINLLQVIEYNQNMFVTNIFQDNRYDMALQEWLLENVGGTEQEFLASDELVETYNKWVLEQEQVDRRLWNCDDYDAVSVGTCLSLDINDFKKELNTYLTDYYKDIANFRGSQIYVPQVGNKYISEFYSSLITDLSVMNSVFIEYLINEDEIANRSLYRYPSNFDEDFIDPDDQGWAATRIYRNVLTWYDQNTLDNSYKAMDKSDSLKVGAKFSVESGSNIEGQRISNYNNTGVNYLFTDIIKLSTWIEDSSISDLDIIEVWREVAWFRLNIDKLNGTPYREDEINKVINYWKVEVLKIKP